MKQDMNHNDMKRNNEMRDTVFTTRRHHGYCGRLLRKLLLLVMMNAGSATAWGQTDYTGVKYIASDGNQSSGSYTYSEGSSNNYYLVPTCEPASASDKSDVYNDKTGAQKPFLTTYKIGQDKEAVWVLKQVEDGDGTFYYVIHAKTGKYVVFDPFYSGYSNASSSGNWRRKCMHLQAMESPTDTENAKFIINERDGAYCFIPKDFKDVTPNNSNTYIFWNIADKNQNSRQGTGGNYWGGLVGLYCLASKSTVLDANSRWKFESTLLDAPTISDVDALTGKITVTDNNDLPSGYNVRYEFSNNGTPPADPTALSASMPSDGLSIMDIGTGILKVVIERYGVVLTEVTQKNIVGCATPIISFDHTTSMASITCATAGTTIYYTTNGNTPTTGSTEYGGPFSVTSPTTIKAIATHATLPNSEVATLEITQVATPTIQNNGSNAVSIISATPGATIYYTIDGSTPTTSSTEYVSPLTENVSGVTIKAIAVKENMLISEVGSGSVTLQCAAPVVVRSGNTGFTVSCPFPASGITIYYTTDGSTPTTSSSSTTSGSTVSCSLPVPVNAMAVATNYNNSTVSSTYLTQGLGGDGSAGDPYTIEYQSDVADFNIKANTVAEASKHYKVIATGTLDFSGVNITQDFSGTFDGGLCVLTGLTHALFNTVDGGTVKNVILGNVSIGGYTTVTVESEEKKATGAIANVAKGTARIYNCGILPTTTIRDEDGNITGFTGSSVSGSDYVGGLVGFLDGSARVINCFSYANISSGSVKAGIVGYNNYASKYNDLKTMVMNCMFYGDISTTSGSVYPIYGGQEISNDYNANTDYRLNNYNYFLYEAPFSKNNHTTSPTITAYNCALAAEERFLTRFEFYRHLLNSNRELAAWYATGDATNGKGIGSDNKMLKWVLDKSIAPYPILKVQGEYPSIVNYDEVYTFNSSGDKVARTSVTELNKGGIVTTLGTNGSLTINIQMGSGGAKFGAPSGAAITTSSVDKPIIDKDFDQYNFNYGKVQLPYYNEVGTKNYTGNRVVTGWKIVSMTGGTSGGYSETNYDAPNYNYADRDHYGKDIYGSGGSGRIFAQGAYFNVPTGVTAITIEPYWAKCAYLSNKYYDRYGYNTTDDDLSQIGGSHYEAASPTITIDSSTQNVYTTLADARSSMGSTYESGSTVYDYAIVLVGNYHHHTNDAAGEGAELNDVTAKPLTITSVDLNEDNEPDYCLIFRSGKQKPVAPIRYDFITLPGMAMAMKMATHDNLAIPGNCKPRGWFEVTTTGLIKFGQFEHSSEEKKDKTAPLILMGGIFDQFVSNNSGNGIDYTKWTNYILLGDNVWFQLLSDGTHSDKTSPTPHRPISITGGEFDVLYLSGYFKPEADACTADNGDRNAKCYIDGGKFSEVAGAGQEKIDGNVTWIINHADIDNFYGGGINSEKAITGNIHTTIKNSRVDVFCGGPKFGNMASTKTVVTEATGCIFRKYFGAGYGGTAIYRDRIANQWESLNYINDSKGDWANWISNSYDKSSGGSKRGNFASGKGVAVNYEYEFFGGAKGNVARLYIDYASFSLAQTNEVRSTLNNCKVLENFYGGGSLGAVAGDATSTLTDCTVSGNVFGAGYSVDIPTVTVRNTGGWTDTDGQSVVPYYNNSTAIYEEPIWQSEVTYTWDHQSVSDGNNALVADGLKIKTNDSLDDLGAVTGNVILTLNGNTKVTGNVFGGGEASAVKGAGNTVTVNLKGNTIVSGNVFGGGDNGVVEGSTEVNIEYEE